MSSQASTVELNLIQLANGAKGLLDEVATGKITGEEDRYSHTDLSEGEVKELSTALDAVSEPVSQVAGVVAES